MIKKRPSRMKNISTAFLLVVVSLQICGCANPRTAVLVTEYDDLAEVRLAYDPTKIAPAVLEDLIRFSPYLRADLQLVPPFLELCIADDPEYMECGTRQLGSDNFFINAEVNLRRGQKLLELLNQVIVPTELWPVVQFRRRGTSFQLCLEGARLAYYRGNDKALHTTCDTVDASTVCAEILEQAPVAQTSSARDQLAQFGWHKCMNWAFQERLGDYPMEHWQAFLDAFDIQETIIRVDD